MNLAAITNTRLTYQDGEAGRPIPAHEAIPAAWRDLAAVHEAAHAVIGAISGIRITRVAIDLTPAERERYQASAIVDHEPAPAGWPIPLSPTAYPDLAAAGYAIECYVGMSQGAWERTTLDRQRLGDDALFAASAEAVCELLRRGQVYEAILVVCRRLISGADVSGDDLINILDAHQLTRGRADIEAAPLWHGPLTAGGMIHADPVAAAHHRAEQGDQA